MELSNWLVQNWQTSSDDPALVDPELLDIVVAPNGVVTLLISHQGMNLDGPQRHYDLVELKPSGNVLELVGNRGLSYEYVSYRAGFSISQSTDWNLSSPDLHMRLASHSSMTELPYWCSSAMPSS